MLSLCESVVSYLHSGDRPMSPLSFAVRLGGGLGGAYLGHSMNPNSRSGFSYGLVNGANLGDFVGDLIDKRDPRYAVRDFAFRTGAGNLITRGMVSANLPSIAGVAGHIGADIATPLVFGPDPKESKKNK